MHYMIVTVINDRFLHFMICTSKLEENSCRGAAFFEGDEGEEWMQFKQRGNHSSCALLEHLWGMSDFGAYRVGEEKLNLLTFNGHYDDGVFDSHRKGSDTLTVDAEYEAISLNLNGEWVDEIAFKGEGMVVLPVTWEWSEDDWTPVWRAEKPFIHVTKVDAIWEDLLKGRVTASLSSLDTWLEDRLSQTDEHSKPTPAAEEWLSSKIEETSKV